MAGTSPAMTGEEASDLGDTLARLWATIEARRGASADTSYTAKLLAAGPAAIARKLGEESLEAVIEAVKGDAAALTRESADLLYHLLVLWAAAGLAPADIAAELSRREGTSGITEKRGRQRD
jgi:phosphoribosyl-ATP pyrophosphohydrolase